MRKLEIGSIKLPTIYVCSDSKDARACKERGIPYIIWRDDYMKLVKLVLYPTLMKVFPHIKWDQALGLRYSDHNRFDKLNVLLSTHGFHDDPSGVSKIDASDLEVTGDQVDDWISRERDALETWDEHDIAKHEVSDSNSTAWSNDNSYRNIGGYTNDLDEIYFSSVSLEDAIGDLSSMVNVQELQKLHLMPKWLGDITDVISMNLDDLAWQEGYNKKLGFPAGNYSGTDELPNLIILDISASIPIGIASTMLSLIETLREQANADLIVTARTSGWYPRGSSLPTPQELRKIHPRGQECEMFNAILQKHVLGKDWGNVISFGDNDSPAKCIFWEQGSKHSEDVLPEYKHKSNTTVKHVWSYHLIKSMRIIDQPITGYARWCKVVSPDAEVTHNTDWANMIRND